MGVQHQLDDNDGLMFLQSTSNGRTSRPFPGTIQASSAIVVISSTHMRKREGFRIDRETPRRVDLLFLFLRERKKDSRPHPLEPLHPSEKKGGRQGRGNPPRQVPRRRTDHGRARLLPPADGAGRRGGTGELKRETNFHHQLCPPPPFISSSSPRLSSFFPSKLPINSSPGPPSPPRATRPALTPWGSRLES